jgi:hypothetical protein
MQRSRHCSTMPSAIAATPVRSMEKVALAAERVPGLAEEAITRHNDVGEEELVGGRRVHAHLPGHRARART